jgi:signal transduction histidine kinase
VQDTGIGLTPAEQAQLFTPFFRAQQETTPRVGGTGLGLAITRALVELHGGAITVTSVSGQGSTFSFTLPTLQEPEGTAGGPAPSSDA